MDTNNKSSEVKTKNITFGLVFAWFFGIVVGIPAIVMLFTKTLVGILLLISALVVFPPTYNLIKDKLHFTISKGLKIAIVIVLFIIAGVVTGNSGSPVKTATSAKSQPTQQAQPSAINVSAAQLFSDYSANQVAADAKYKNNLVEVTGIVGNIGKDILDNPYILLTDGQEYSLTGVQCSFSQSDNSQLATVSKGQQITLRGNVSGLMMNVEVSGCQIVK
jgi:predicted PurR-regulated permease PerM